MSARPDASQPRETRLIALLLHATRTPHDAAVVPQLADLAQRHASSLLSAAAAYAAHADRDDLALADVRLAATAARDAADDAGAHDALLAWAEAWNRRPLGDLRDRVGLRLPHERFCLDAPIFDVVRREHEHEREHEHGDDGGGDVRMADA